MKWVAKVTVEFEVTADTKRDAELTAINEVHRGDMERRSPFLITRVQVKVKK